MTPRPTTTDDRPKPKQQQPVDSNGVMKGRVRRQCPRDRDRTRADCMESIDPSVGRSMENHAWGMTAGLPSLFALAHSGCSGPGGGVGRVLPGPMIRTGTPRFNFAGASVHVDVEGAVEATQGQAQAAQSIPNRLGICCPLVVCGRSVRAQAAGAGAALFKHSMQGASRARRRTTNDIARPELDRD